MTPISYNNQQVSQNRLQTEIIMYLQMTEDTFIRGNFNFGMADLAYLRHTGEACYHIRMYVQ